MREKVTLAIIDENDAYHTVVDDGSQEFKRVNGILRELIDRANDAVINEHRGINLLLGKCHCCGWSIDEVGDCKTDCCAAY